MSSSYDASTSYNALDDTVYDIFDLDAYVSSLSPSVSATESVRNTPVPAPRLKHYPKTRGHPRPSPAVVSPPVVSAASAVASTSTVPSICCCLDLYRPQHLLSPQPLPSPAPPLLSPIREKVISVQPAPHPPPVLWMPPRPCSPPLLSSSPQNSMSALCGCLNVSTSGSHGDGNQGSTNRVYGIWLKSSTPQRT